MTQEELIYSLTLADVPGIGSSKYNALTSRFGGAKGVFAQTESMLTSVQGITNEIAKSILNSKVHVENAEAQILASTEHNARIIMYDDSEYPSRLKERKVGAPTYIYTKGSLNLENRKALAVVGTRNASPKYIQICKTIIAELAQKHPDLIIISGLARGIDETAHAAALGLGLSNISVLPLPLNNIYPAKNKDMADKIAATGLLISEFPFGSKEQKQNFVVRNRIIAALADAVLIVESKEEGGSLHTANYAHSCGVPVGAVVGEFGNNSSQGCNMLIKQNRAALISKTQDVERLLGYIESTDFEQVAIHSSIHTATAQTAKTQTTKANKPQPQQTALKEKTEYDTTALSEEAKRVFCHIYDNGGSAFAEDIAEALGLEISKLSDILFDLEMDDYIEQKSGNQYAVI